MALVAFKVAGLALGVNYAVHVASALAYAKLCVPESIWGIASSVVATASPVCSVFLNVMTLTQNNYAVILTTSVAAAMAGLVKR